MNKIKHARIEDIVPVHKCGHEGYEYCRRKFIPFGGAAHTLVSVYEIPPRKAAYPYHYHHKNEETFYILSGEGILRTPDGERRVAAGELLFFPTGPAGAHKLTNSSDTEKLVYIDFDVVQISTSQFTRIPASSVSGAWTSTRSIPNPPMWTTIRGNDLS